jgi:hypothetical protein
MILTPHQNELVPIELESLTSGQCRRILNDLNFYRDVLICLNDDFEFGIWGCLDSGLL